MTDKSQTVVTPLNKVYGSPGGFGAYDDLMAAEDRPAEFFSGLVSLGFIKAAIRRSARFWCATAIIGLLAGISYYAASPPAYQASTSVLLTLGPYEDINTAATDAQAIAQSRAVAQLAVQKTGFRQSASSFLAGYKVTIVPNRVLVFTVTAPSPDQAARRADAVATAFLQFRGDQVETQQKLVLGALDQQIDQARQQLSSIGAQISQVSAQPASSSQQSQLSSLRTAQTQATTTLTSLESNADGVRGNDQPITAAAVKGSKVLDTAALIPHSRLKPLLLYAAIGLIVGLVLSMGIIVIRALVSDRLRERDDIAQALGAPIRLSVGTSVSPDRRPLGRRRRSEREANVQRITAYLRGAVRWRSRGIPSLAIVPVGDSRAAAASVVSLAVNCAQQGTHVLLADLVRGAPAARLLGASEPGVSSVSAHDGRLVVAVPDHDDLAPAGPLNQERSQAGGLPPTEAVTAAYASAGVVLTLATLDPALGGDHLATWATHAIAVITAGQASWAKINAVGEMVRMSGTHLVGAVLIGADKTDETLGATSTLEANREPNGIELGLHSGTDGFVRGVDRSAGGRLPDDG